MFSLSKDQQKALDNLIFWFDSTKRTPYITLGGYAGTGKTTLIARFREELSKKNKNLKVAFGAYTGKAARVLQSKLELIDVVHAKDKVGTIHSLIYEPIEDKNGEIVGWRKREKEEGVSFDLFIIDEASMVDENIWNDLLSYNKPIIAIGDHGQLPPIKGSFNLMSNPQLKLEEIHRQASFSPIIEVSIQARTLGQIEQREYSRYVKKLTYSSDTSELVNGLLSSRGNDYLVLCGMNHTRVRLNNMIRSLREFETTSPSTNDRVICLRNNREQAIYNGELGTIKSIERNGDDYYKVEIDFDEGYLYKGNILKEQFNSKESLNFTQSRSKTIKSDLFDFGYALTVHKAQGSQAKRIVLFEERSRYMDDQMYARWLYTAVTRAEEELFIFDLNAN